MSFYEVDEGIALCKTEGSKVEKLYHYLCENHNVDQGEPFYYHVHLLINDSFKHFMIDVGGHYSIISKLCNIIVICLSFPLDMCRIIFSDDDFKSAWVPSEILYGGSNYGSEELGILRADPDCIDFSKVGSIGYSEKSATIKDTICKEIKDFWSEQKTIGGCHRIENALSYFFYSWRSFYLEHVCINLAIVLESLFSPPSSTELSHQIAFNLSKMQGSSSDQRESYYRLIKNFYSLRSSIVHGGRVKRHELFRIVPPVFHLTARILKRILIEPELSSLFRDEKKLNQLFNQWLFK